MIIASCAALIAAVAPLLDRSGPIDVAAAQSWTSAARQQLGRCQNDVAFLVALGRVLRALGQTDEAAEHLERALLLAPNDPAALRAFAQALADLGDPTAARQILALAAPLEPNTSGNPSSRSQGWRPPVRIAWRDAWSLTGGAERNLLGVTSASTLTLTLPGLDPSRPVLVTLPLEASAQPRSGGYLQAGASWQAFISRDTDPRGDSQQEWGLQAAVRWRQVPALPAAGFATVEVAATHQRRYASKPWGHHFSAMAAYLDSRTGVTYGQAGLTAALDGTAWGCQARAGVEWLARRYGSNPVLDGHQSALQLQAACSPALQLTLRGGRDQPMDSQRPGGVQQLVDLRARGQFGAWAWEAEWARLRDRSGYSPLLDAGAPRHQTRRAWRVERVAYSQRQTGCDDCRRQLLLVGLEAQQRQSRIELFKTNNLGLFMSWQIIK